MNLKRKYVAAIYDEPSQDRLREWSQNNGFDLSFGYGGKPQDPKEFDFHTTIFYTSNVMEDLPDEPGYKLIESYSVTPMSFDLLGEEKNIPVIKLAPEGMIVDLRKTYEKIGMKDQWPEYLPHISLSYVRKDYNLDNISLPAFPITFNRVKVEDILE
jgi:2'-5' RNA ligase